LATYGQKLNDSEKQPYLEKQKEAQLKRQQALSVWNKKWGVPSD